MPTSKKGSHAGAKEFTLVPKAELRRVLAALKITWVRAEKKHIILNLGSKGNHWIPMGRICHPPGPWRKGQTLFKKVRIKS